MVWFSVSFSVWFGMVSVAIAVFFGGLGFCVGVFVWMRFGEVREEVLVCVGSFFGNRFGGSMVLDGWD